MGQIFSGNKKPEPAPTRTTGRDSNLYNYNGVPTATSRAPTSYAHTFADNKFSTRPASTTTTARPTTTVSPTSSYNPYGSGYNTKPAPTATTNRSATSSAAASSTYRNMNTQAKQPIFKPPAPPTNRQTAPNSYQFDYSSEEDDLAGEFSNLSLAAKENGTPVYTVCVTRNRICVFEPAREKFIETYREKFSLENIKEGEVYHTQSITRDAVGDLELPSALTRKQYVERKSFVFGSKQSYVDLILPALLLGSRVRDFEQRCATVIQMGDLVLNMPAQGRRLLKGKPLKLKTISGQIFEVEVKFVQKIDAAEKRWIVECAAPKTPLPHKVRQGCLLEIMGSYNVQPRVTGALMHYYPGSGNQHRQKSLNGVKTESIEKWGLLSAIYGARGKRDFPAVDHADSRIRLAKNAGFVTLNPEQAEAIARYNCDACPAFVVESPPGSGKTMTAAAMAVSYKGSGVQLFLSTANVPVINMALALAKLDYGSRTAIHLISSEREDLMTEETRSPFSVLSLAKARSDTLSEKIERLEEQLKHAPNDEEKEKLKKAIVLACGPVFADTYDVYFGTVDMMLGRLFKGNQNGKHQEDAIKKQLKNSVRRIVVDEASQLTEAALNALILCFPKAQIVLIGDSKQLPPFRFTPSEVVSELAARPALDVIKDKMNLPVIKLTHVYRATKALMAHYSEVFYAGLLVSFKRETYKNPLSCFGARAGGSRCLFWKVPKGVAKMHGTSKFNWGELQSLRYLVNILKNSGYDSKSVMIISYYEAQRKKAEEELEKANLKEYELLTVDSAQGREKKVVIVLTTRTSVPVDGGSFFSCALRCNVAVSRHQEALIVLGHPSIAAAPNWSRVLSQKYFKPVEDMRK